MVAALETRNNVPMLSRVPSSSDFDPTTFFFSFMSIKEERGPDSSCLAGICKRNNEKRGDKHRKAGDEQDGENSSNKDILNIY